MSLSVADIKLAYQDVDGSEFKIRGLDYMKNKLKVSPNLYWCILVNNFALNT